VDASSLRLLGGARTVRGLGGSRGVSLFAPHAGSVGGTASEPFLAAADAAVAAWGGAQPSPASASAAGGSGPGSSVSAGRTGHHRFGSRASASEGGAASSTRARGRSSLAAVNRQYLGVGAVNAGEHASGADVAVFSADATSITAEGRHVTAPSGSFSARKQAPAGGGASLAHANARSGESGGAGGYSGSGSGAGSSLHRTGQPSAVSLLWDSGTGDDAAAGSGRGGAAGRGFGDDSGGEGADACCAPCMRCCCSGLLRSPVVAAENGEEEEAQALQPAPRRALLQECCWHWGAVAVTTQRVALAVVLGLHVLGVLALLGLVAYGLATRSNANA